jgi:hypothetical protein
MAISMGDECTVVAVTEKVLLVETPDEGEVWVPKSVLAPDHEECLDVESEKHDTGELMVRTWWADKQGYS